MVLSFTFTSAQPFCTICPKIRDCPQELYSDSVIDPIYETLMRSVRAPGYPQQLLKAVNQKNVSYTFVWPTESYVANADLATLEFSITVFSNLEKFISAQKKTLKTIKLFFDDEEVFVG